MVNKIERIKIAVEKLQDKDDKELEDFYKFLSKPYDELSIILKGYTYVEELINQVFSLVFVNYEKIKDERMYLLTKCKILEALGYIDVPEIMEKIVWLNRIRGKFAHDYRYKLPENEVKEFTKGLIFKSKTSKKQILLRTLMMLIGFFYGMRGFEKLAPFYNTIYRNRNIFKRDLGYDEKEILKNYPNGGNFNQYFVRK